MVRALEPLKQPLFRRFFAGQGISQLGDWVFFVALPWQVLVLTGSKAALGGVFAAFMGAQVALLLVGGVLVDRLPRRTLIVVSDVLQAILAGVLASLAFSGALVLWHLYVVGALFGAAQAFAMPALSAFVPDTVPKSDLQAANSLYQGTRTGAGIVGPAIGGVVIAVWGTGAAFALDALSFLVSALLLATVHPLPGDHVEQAPGPTSHPLDDLREGIAYVRKIPWLWIGILIFSLWNAVEAGPRNVVLPAYVGDDLGGGAPAIGFVNSAAMGGLMVGYLIMGLLPRVERPGIVAYAFATIAAASIALLGFTTALWETYTLSFVRGAALAVGMIQWETSVMEQVEERVRGRVFSLDMFGSFLLMPVSLYAMGYLAEAVGARLVLLAGGLLAMALSLAGLASRRARTFEVPAPAHATGSSPEP